MLIRSDIETRITLKNLELVIIDFILNLFTIYFLQPNLYIFLIIWFNSNLKLKRISSFPFRLYLHYLSTWLQFVSQFHIPLGQRVELLLFFGFIVQILNICTFSVLLYFKIHSLCGFYVVNIISILKVYSILHIK